MGGEHFGIIGAAYAVGYIYLYIYPLLVYHKIGAAVKSFCKKIREFYLSEHAKTALFMWVKKA